MASSSLERQVSGYLNPKYHKLFVAYKETKDMGKSELVSLAIQRFFDSLPPAEIRFLLGRGELKKVV
jgi:hypothetical protein